MNDNNNTKTVVVFEKILKRLPTYFNIFLEATNNPLISQWNQIDYQNAIKWAEYFEKVENTKSFLFIY